MSAKIYRFPIERTKIGTWVNKAFAIYKQNNDNISKSRMWVSINVPIHFTAVVMSLVLQLVNREQEV